MADSIHQDEGNADQVIGAIMAAVIIGAGIAAAAALLSGLDKS